MKNRKVIYTCITGDYDIPVIHSIPPGWEYYVFTNNPKITHTHLLENNGLSDVKLARRVKILPWEYFDAEICVWIDGNTTFSQSELLKLVGYVEKKKCEMVMVQHPIRTCLYQELSAVLMFKKDTHETCTKIAQRYSEEGIPRNVGMVSSHGIIRSHTPEVKKLCELWWKEVESNSHRDQLSFNYVKYLNPIELMLIPYDTTFKVAHKHTHQKTKLPKGKWRKPPTVGAPISRLDKYRAYRNMKMKAKLSEPIL